ncbi:hypothetical protein K458DRAFT_392525 [Lentithecium fluviatile CBS 122367]|uniref:Uncharacterized protein n=1 Tax=Lentithecium fluviatile CBS 122367 TaxID=1168545 RepID=A0A6G1IRH7_9PLEO|nr:hypothetical protein K458DRAFT_392525 [Lentithecium fluviatile CBS 122367]
MSKKKLGSSKEKPEESKEISISAAKALFISEAKFLKDSQKSGKIPTYKEINHLFMTCDYLLEMRSEKRFKGRTIAKGKGVQEVVNNTEELKGDIEVMFESEMKKKPHQRIDGLLDKGTGHCRPRLGSLAFCTGLSAFYEPCRRGLRFCGLLAACGPAFPQCQHSQAKQ